MKIFKPFLYIIFVLTIVAMIIIAAGARFIFSGMAPVYEMEEYTPALTTKVFDVNNELIYEFSVEKRAMTPLEDIPVDLQNALIAMEDRDFFNHPGISLKGITRALLHDIFTGRAKQGGSTLTQQLSRGVFLTKEKKIIRKIREILLALQIEHQFSKQEILQLYLNEIYLGQGVYGVKTAAQKYFNKDLQDITTSEAALIVGLIPAPGRYNPFVNPDTALMRRNLVLRVMLEQGYISREIYDAALLEPLPTKATVAEAVTKPGLYFIEHIRRTLEPKYGVDAFWKSGMSIYTTIDIKKQVAAEEIINARLNEYDLKIAAGLGIELPEFSETENYNEEAEQTPLPDFPKLQGAFMARDVKTGAVRVMVGGRDFDASKYNRATQARRQPGSSFKPYVWMAAVQKGYTPATLVKDLQTVFYYDGRNWRTFDEEEDQYSLKLAEQPFVSSKDFSVWVPQNIGQRSSGWTTLRRALEKSLNLVAVNLIDAVGIPAVRKVARDAGIKSDLPYVPALALGVSAVTVDEHLAGLTTFGNGGIYTPNYYIERVEDKNGYILEQHIEQERAAFTPQDSYLMISMMKGVVQRGSGTAARRLSYNIAGKTGTSQESRDMWFVGMTPHTAAAGWMGYDDDTSQEHGQWTGGGTTAVWWTEIMEKVLEGEPKDDFPVPDGITFAFINPDTGKLAAPTAKNKFLETFKKGTEPKSF